MLNWLEFEKIDMRVGTVLSSEIFKEAKKPSYKLTIDFGELGIKKSSAQITELYQANEIIGKQVVCVVNFPPKQIANMMSECLVLGALGNENKVTLLGLDKQVENGEKIG